jgi:hypothetical protein
MHNASANLMDGKTRMKIPDPTRPGQSLKAYRAEQYGHAGRSNGMMSLYNAFDILTKNVTGTVAMQFRSRAFLNFLDRIDESLIGESGIPT